MLGFLLILVASRLLGAYGAGVLIQFIGIFTIASVLGKFGLDSAALWRLPQLSEQDPQRVRGHVHFLLLCASTSGAIAAVLVVAGLPSALALGDQPELARTIETVAWLIPAGVLVLVAMAIVRALGSIKPFVVYGNIGLPLLRVVAVSTAAAVGTSAIAVAFTWAVALVPILVALLLVIGRQLTKVRPPEVTSGSHAQVKSWPNRVERRMLLAFAVPRTVSAGLEQLLTWSHILIVGAILGPAAAGIYGAASRFIAAGLIVDTALRIVVSPRFSVLLHRRDIDGAQDLYRTATRWLVLFATPGFVILSVFSPVVLGWLGEGFRQGATALVLLSVGAMVTFLAGNTHSVLLMSGYAGWAACNKAVALAISIAGCLILIPRYGLAGAALAWATAVLLDAALAALEVRWLVGVRPEIPVALGSLFLSGLTVGVPAVVARSVLGPTNAALLVALVSGAAVFLGTVFLLRGPLQLSGLRAKP